MTGTSGKADMPAETNYPHVARWVQDFGWIEIGQDDFSRSMVRALDIGGLIWEGKPRYATPGRRAARSRSGAGSVVQGRDAGVRGIRDGREKTRSVA